MHQIATTIEQSRRLLARPDIVPEDSADMYYQEYSSIFGVIFETRLLIKSNPAPIGTEISPAWSLSALWGILNSFGMIYDFPTTLSPEELIEKMVEIIETAEPF